MNKPEPREISKSFFLENNLPEKPTLGDLVRVFVIAAKRYIEKEIDSYSFSAISGAIYYDYVLFTQLLHTSLGCVLDSASELNFYKDNLEIFKNPQTLEQQQAFDYSLRTIMGYENEIKGFLQYYKSYKDLQPGTQQPIRVFGKKVDAHR